MKGISKKNFGKYIKKKREEIGISREDLAKKIYVSYEALAKWESGLRVPDFGMIGILADALGVSVQDIYDNSKSEGDGKIAEIFVSSLLVIAVIGGCILGVLHGGKGRENPGAIISSEESNSELVINVNEFFFFNENPKDFGIYFNEYTWSPAEKGYTQKIGSFEATTAITDAQIEKLISRIIDCGYVPEEEKTDSGKQSLYYTRHFSSYYKEDGINESMRTTGTVSFHFEDGKVTYLYNSPLGSTPN